MAWIIAILPAGKHDFGRPRLDERNRISDGPDGIREIRIDHHDDAALRFRHAAADQRAVPVAIPRVEYANVEVEPGGL